MKAVLIIIEGMADRSQAALGGLTPLQAAVTPNLDALARSGACGHMYTLGPGVSPSTEIAQWEMLGYGDIPFPGRASIEAVGAGCGLGPEDVVFGINLASTMVDGGARYVQASPACLPEEHVAELHAALAEYEPRCFAARLFHLGGPFMALALSGGASPCVTDSDPLFYRLPVPPIVPIDGAGPAALETAAELTSFTEWAEGVLRFHPVNRKRADEGMTVVDYVLVKWPSVVPDVPPFYETWGFDALLSAPGLLCSGMARVLGMEYIGAAGGEAPEVFGCSLSEALEALRGGRDFALVRTTAAEEASLTGRPSRKVRALAELDAELAPLVDECESGGELLAVVTAGHTTPSGGSVEVIHSGESVPVAMVGRNVRVDGVDSFDEISCAGGSLGLLRGSDIMPLVLDFTDRARFGTSRTTPAPLRYRPRE